MDRFQPGDIVEAIEDDSCKGCRLFKGSVYTIEAQTGRVTSQCTLYGHCNSDAVQICEKELPRGWHWCAHSFRLLRRPLPDAFAELLKTPVPTLVEKALIE